MESKLVLGKILHQNFQFQAGANFHTFHLDCFLHHRLVKVQTGKDTLELQLLQTLFNLGVEGGQSATIHVVVHVGTSYDCCKLTADKCHLFVAS